MLKLLPATETVLKLVWSLISYFHSQDKSPLFLLNFFEKPSSEVRLYFVHSQALYFHDAVKEVEGQRFTVFEVTDNNNGLKNTLMFKLEDCLLPSAVRTILGGRNRGTATSIRGTNFHATALTVYETVLS
jgi:hypothetical protein